MKANVSLIIFLYIAPDKYDFQVLSTLLNKYTPCVEPCLPHGFFLDFTGESRIKEYLPKMSRQLAEHLGAGFCLGMGPNKLLSRQIAEAGGLNRGKPNIAAVSPYISYSLPTSQNTLWYVKPDQLSKFIEVQSVNSLWPCPEEIIKKLKKLGIHYNRQLVQIPLEQLKQHFEGWGQLLYQYSRGLDTSSVKSPKTGQEISYTRRLTQPTTSLQVVGAAITEGSKYIAEKLQEQQAGFLKLVCYFYLKNNAAELKRQFNQPQSSWTSLRDNLMLLVKGERSLSQPVYGLKISVQGIAPQLGTQLALFQPLQQLKSRECDSHYRLEQAIHNLQKRFNKQVVCLGKDITISRREQMLQLIDPLRKDSNGGTANGQVCTQAAKSIL